MKINLADEIYLALLHDDEGVFSLKNSIRLSY